MNLLGNTNYTLNPNFRKQCLETWLETGAATKAGHLLGIDKSIVRLNSWKYLLANPDDARKILNSQAEEDRRYSRDLTDEEFWGLLVRKAMLYLTKNQFNRFVQENQLWRYPKVYDLFKVRHPDIYAKYLNQVSR